GPVEVRALAAELDLRPTKRLGQNFVHDANTVRRIVRAADLAPDDVVLEVGPGLGSLTLGLLEAARAGCAGGPARAAPRRPRGAARPAPRPGRPAARRHRGRAARACCGPAGRADRA